MPNYPKKQIGQYQGPGWRTTPPSAGAYLPGAGNRKLQQAQAFAGLSRSLAGAGTELGAARSEEQVKQAQQLVMENEAEFRRLEQAGELDWTPAMLKGAHSMQGELAGRKFVQDYRVRMGSLSIEESADIAAPRRIFDEMLAAHLQESPDRNTYYDDSFSSHALTNGLNRVDDFTVAAGKSAKSQGIYTLGILASTTVVDSLSRLDGIDPKSAAYNALAQEVEDEIVAGLSQIANGTGEEDESGTIDTGAYGAGFWTGNRGAGALQFFTASIAAGSSGKYDPQITLRAMERLQVGPHKLTDIAEIKSVLADNDKTVKEIRDTWFKNESAQFWSRWDTALVGTPRDLTARHRNRLVSRDTAKTELDGWFVTRRTALESHYGLDPSDASDLSAFSSSKELGFNRAKSDLMKQYQASSTTINTQQQIHIAIAPTLADLTEAVDFTEATLTEEVGTLTEKIGLGITAGDRNYESIVAGSISRIADLVDPETITTSDPDGRPFGATGASDYVDRHLYETFFAADTAPAARVAFVLQLGLQNHTTQGLLGKWITNQAEHLVALNAVSRMQLPASQDPFSLPPADRTLSTGFRDLPRDAGELTRDDIEGSGILDAFAVFEGVRSQSNTAVTVLGIKDTPISDIFEAAFRLKGGSASHRLVQAAKHAKIADLGGPSPLTPHARSMIGATLFNRGLTADHIDIAGTMLQQQWDKISATTDSDVQAAEDLNTWAKQNVAAEEGVYVRIGQPADLPAWKPEYGLDEAGFFRQFKADIEAQLDDPSVSVEFTVLSVLGKTQVIPQGVRRVDSGFGWEDVVRTAHKYSGAPGLITSFLRTPARAEAKRKKQEIMGDVTRIDLLDYGIKSSYSNDDLNYLLDAYAEPMIEREFERTAVGEEIKRAILDPLRVERTVFQLATQELRDLFMEEFGGSSGR